MASAIADVRNSGQSRPSPFAGRYRLLTQNGHFEVSDLRRLLILRHGCQSVSKPQKIFDLTLSPTLILGRERIDTSIDADVANEELGPLDKVRYLVNGSSTETTCGSCHRRAPLPPSQRYLAFRSQIRKFANLIW